MANTQFHISNFWGRPSLGRKPRFFSPLVFDVQTNSDHKTQKIKLYSVRALKRYLNEEHLIRGRVMATNSKFRPQIYEAYFRLMVSWNGQLSSSLNKTCSNLVKLHVLLYIV